MLLGSEPDSPPKGRKKVHHSLYQVVIQKKDGEFSVLTEAGAVALEGGLAALEESPALSEKDRIEQELRKLNPVGIEESFSASLAKTRAKMEAEKEMEASDDQEEIAAAVEGELLSVEERSIGSGQDPTALENEPAILEEEPMVLEEVTPDLEPGSAAAQEEEDEEEEKDEEEKDFLRGGDQSNKPTSLALRLAIQARDGGRCTCCRKLSSGKTHHKMYRGLGGPTRPDNLHYLCDGCHGLVHAGFLVVSGKVPDGLKFRRTGKLLL
jgi:hypothetical protein